MESYGNLASLNDNMTSDELEAKVNSVCGILPNNLQPKIRNWISGPGEELLLAQNSKPYNFEEASEIRKQHEQFEFKCMKALENFAALCEFRKKSLPSAEISELDRSVQNYVERLNKRTFFVVSCYSYFRLIEELWRILEQTQKRSREVDTYDLVSIKNAITDLETGIEKSDMRLNNLAHELERLKVILTPSDQTYLGQLESSFNDACKTVSERTQEMRIRKLMLKKQSKLLECEDNVYESISWIEELLENVQILYQENCVGKNQLEAEELLSKCADIYKQAQTTHTYCAQLLETYGKLCEADGKKLPRNVYLSKNRLSRVWPRLEDRLFELKQRISGAKHLYNQIDSLLSRVQGHLMDLARNQLTCSSKLETVLATGAKASAPYDQEKLNSATQDFRDAKTLGVQLLERLPKGFLQDDSGFTSPVVKEVSRLIRLKLYTLWLKLRELEYTVTGSNVPDNETVKELGIDTSYLDRRPQSTSAFYPRTRSSLDDGYRGSFLSVDENERRRRNQPIPYLDADDFFPLTGLPGREIRLPHKLSSTTIPTDMLRGAQTPDSVTRNKQRTPSRNGRASAEPMESSKRASKDRDNVKKLIDNLGHLMDEFRNRLSDLGTAVHEIPPTNFRELDKLKMMADGEFARVNARLHECCNECGDDPLGKEIIDRSGRDAEQLHRQWVAEWNAHLRGHGQISPSAGLLKRLQDLIFDLDECKRRLADLRNAVCYSTVEKAKMASIANDAKSSSLVLSCLITSDDINRVTVIHEEIVGMNNTLSAQEKFITDLLDQVRGDQRLVYQPQLLKIRQSWKEYKDELAIFDGFITYLEKAYKLLPRIEEFSSHQSRPKSYRKKISELTRSQAEGHRLQADIADLIRPDRLHPRAEEVGETGEVKPRVGWLVNHLKQKFRTVTGLTDELDMLLTNLMTGLSLDEINGDLLLRNHSSTPVENGGMLTGMYRPSSATNNRIPSQSAPPFLDDPWSLTGYEGGISKIPARNPLDLAPPRPPRTASGMDSSMNALDQQYPIKELSNGSVSNSSSWRIIQPLTDITCKVDDSVDFHCHFAGPTDMSLLGIEWTFQPFTYSIKEPFYGNKEHISKDTQQFTRLSDRNNARLKIRNVRVGQAGAYTVKIQNLKTGKTMKSTGMLKVRPDLLKTMENAAAQQLDPSSGLLTPVHFSVAYRGFTSIPIVEWRHDRHELNKKAWQIKTDETRTSISTKTAHLCDKGMYECYLRDPLTDMQLYSSAELKVDLVGNNAKNKNIPILITGDGGVSEAVHDGDPLTLKCPFRQPTNSTDYSVSWLQNGQTMYTFRPNATDTNRPVKTKEIQFQRGQTIWRFYIVESYCILSTNVVHRSDEGKYICRVKENGSVFENSATITVTILLEFAEALQRKSIINGREMDLLCCLKAPSQFLQDPKTIQINWFLNNRLLNPYRCIRLGISLTNDRGRLGLHVVKTTVEHAGTYCCEATLDDSTVRTQCDVEVLERSIPRIIKMTRIPSGSLTPNQTVTISYEYSGVPQPSCEWFKDNESIHPDGIHYKLEVFQKHCTLTIINVDTTDSGIYRIKLGNELGVAEATEIVTVTGLSENESEKTTSTIVRAIPFPGHQPISENLSILSEPHGVHDTLSASASIFLIRPVDVQARVGENAHIFCLLKNLADPVTVFWYHDNELLKSGKGSSIRTYTNQPKRGFHRVELVNVSMACAGSYKVRVCKSNLTSAEVPNEVLADSVFTVTVKEAKYVEDLLKPCAPHFMGSGLCSFVKATVSDRIELSCAIEGVPTPWFCWIKDYQVLKNTTEGEVQMHREDNVYRLIVENAGLEHAGIWDFVCYNAHGLLTASCQFDITGKERQSDETLADTLTSETGNRTDSIPQTISTNPKGRPKYDPIVPKAIPELSETEKQSTQTKSQKADLEPPEFSSVFTDTTCYAGETVRLKCCITGSPSPSTEWNFNGKPIDNLNNRIDSGCTGNEHWLTIRNACVQDSGRYDITAENIVGIATCSAVLFVCDPQANRPVSPSSEPGFFTAITESSASRLRSHEHPCRTSGTQTPSNQRVSTIRSVSMSSLRGNLEDDPRRRSNPCLEYRCFFRKNGSVDSELVDDGVFIDEGSPNTYKVSRNTAPPVLRRRRAPITRTQRSSSTGTRDRISRVRSEEHLIHHCPVCSTIMMPMHPMQDTAGSCILPNVVYTPISSCDSMLVESICPHCYGAKRYSFSNEVAKHTSVNPNENNLQNSFVSSEKTTNREREIPIKRLGTPSAYKNPAKVHIVQEHSVNETWYHKDQPAVLPTKPTDPESYSVVESSDGDS